MAGDYLDLLADFVTNTNLEDLSPATVNAAKKVALDTAGAMVGGSRQPENAEFAKLVKTMSGPGRAALIGHQGTVQPVFAALVNATAGVALEMDEGSRLGGGHPSIHVTPGALAVAEELGRSGKETLESIIVGYEVTSRIGSGAKPRQEVHSHGTWGTIGAAAATARLLGFDSEQARRAMNLAMSMSPANTWTPCLEGATVRNLYPGRSGFQGIMAAYLGQCGFTAVKDGPADLYDGFLGQGFDPDAAVKGLGDGGKLRIEQNYFKLHACCLYNHPVLDAVQMLRSREQFSAADVERVEVAAPPIVQIMANPKPENMLSAKFSIPYAVAAAIVTGHTDITAFYQDRLDHAETGGLARRVEVLADEQMDLRRYDYPAAQVKVFLKNNRVLEESVTAHYGDSANPVTEEDLVAKFYSLAVDTLGNEGAGKVVDTVSRLEELHDIGEFTALLRGR